MLQQLFFSNHVKKDIQLSKGQLNRDKLITVEIIATRQCFIDQHLVWE